MNSTPPRAERVNPRRRRRSATQTSFSGRTLTQETAIVVRRVQLGQPRHGPRIAARRMPASASASSGAVAARAYSTAVPRERDEPVRLTKIYTRGGDAGETSLGDGSRCRSSTGASPPTAPSTSSTRHSASSSRATARPRSATCSPACRTSSSTSAPTSRFRSSTREGCARRRSRSTSSSPTATASTPSCPSSRASCSPAGAAAAAQLHVARTVCRRAEREALAASTEHTLSPLTLVYLNRLSDLLFILARAANASAGGGASRSGSPEGRR